MKTIEGIDFFSKKGGTGESKAYVNTVGDVLTIQPYLERGSTFKINVEGMVDGYSDVFVKLEGIDAGTGDAITDIDSESIYRFDISGIPLIRIKAVTNANSNELYVHGVIASK